MKTDEVKDTQERDELFTMLSAVIERLQKFEIAPPAAAPSPASDDGPHPHAKKRSPSRSPFVANPYSNKHWSTGK